MVPILLLRSPFSKNGNGSSALDPVDEDFTDDEDSEKVAGLKPPGVGCDIHSQRAAHVAPNLADVFL